MRIRLCPPLTATSAARLAASCPIISEKSIYPAGVSDDISLSV